MILRICDAEYSLQWNGVYQFALSEYPSISDWELERIAAFIAYEKLYQRQTQIECSNVGLKEKIQTYIKAYQYVPPCRPTDKLVAGTYDTNKQLRISPFCSHTCTVEAAFEIMKSTCLLSAVGAFKKVRKSWF